MFTAIISDPVLPVDGTYKVLTLDGRQREKALASLVEVTHYIGHPNTKAIVEGLGAIPAPTKFFPGLQPGESALCLDLASTYKFIRILTRVN